MPRLTRNIIDHERMDVAVAIFEAREAGDKERQLKLDYYYRRLTAILSYLDTGVPIPPV